ncbi:hypothetical protein CONLIGDRAFT_684168 [Coniochaeta ligniaria NRRL 30616]|uniref:Uncharacterized protein n=1 Tax=Coniochaeta ligniaria NRRL 30616 TaxID=1408157 RepID=A0A1J7IDS1_9PEZI|nr:hypothetical protein CONLIGDRAFT_684168 [Coniochaeta ligniaria NRRL 30616]
MLDYASTTARKDFVLRLGQRLCPSRSSSHRVVIDRGGRFVRGDAGAESYRDFVMVDEEFFDCLKSLVFLCEAVPGLVGTMGPGLVTQAPLDHMLEVLRRAEAEAKRSVEASYYPRVYLDDIVPPTPAADDENPGLAPRHGAGLLRRRGTMAPTNPTAAAEASNNRASATNTHLPPTTIFGQTQPTNHPALPPTTIFGQTQPTTTTTSGPTQPTTRSGPGATPAPRNNAAPLKSAQKVQQFHNQTINNYNKGKNKIPLEDFVWVPTRSGGGFFNAAAASWDADWRVLEREAGGYESADDE